MAYEIPKEFPTPKNGRVALLGDTHANTWWTLRVIKALAEEGIKTVVQLGDFGWWPQLAFARKVSRDAQKAGVQVLFLDGNHEHHPNLRKCARNADPESENGRPVQLHPDLWYLPRGCAWQWGDTKFRALGGAFSVDRPFRISGKTWFIEELPSDEDLQRAIDAGPADVLLSHDYPALGYHLPSTLNIDEELDRISRLVQERLAEVAKAIQPKLVVHGHWHRRYTTQQDGTTIEGLNCDDKPGAILILETDTLQTEDWAIPVPHR